MRHFLYLREAAQNENGLTKGAGELLETESAELAAQLKKDNKAVEIDATLVDVYAQKLEAEFNRYTQRMQSIRDSKDPIYDVHGKRNHDLAVIEEEREKSLRNIQLDYEFEIKDMLKQAEETQAQTVPQYSDSDKHHAERLAEMFETRAHRDYGYAIDQLKNSLDKSSVEQLAAFQSQLSKVYAVIEQKEERPAITKSVILSNVEKGLPIDIVSAIEQLPRAEELSTKVMVDSVMKHRSIAEEGHTKTELIRPSMREVAAKYDKDSLPLEFQA